MNDENENNCGICQSSLDTGRTKTVHQNKKVWRHEFHKPCIDAWIKTCIQANRPPSCPLCPSFVIPDDKIPSNMKPKVLAPVLVQELAQAQEPTEEEISVQVARDRWRQILRHINYNDNVPLYTGIMICSRGRPCVHMFNPDNRINPAWNLGRIKEHVRRANRIVYSHKGILDADNLAHNTTLSNWTQMKYPELRIVDAYYGIPSQSGRLGKFDIEMTDDKTVEEMYIEYQTLIRENIKRSDLSETIKENMRDIYYETNLEFNHSTGPDDPGHYDRAFLSPANPIIPIEHRRYRRYSQSTEYSLMWLMVDVEYVV
jgi:hypothetical protein